MGDRFGLSDEDFRQRYVFFVDLQGGPDVGIAPFQVITDMGIPARRQDANWVARFTPIMNLANSLMHHDRRVNYKTAEVKAALRKYLSAHPGATSDDVEDSGALAREVEESSRALGEAIHKSHPFTSPLFLLKMINDPSITLAAFDAVVADEMLATELTKPKERRKNSIGEVEMKVDTDLPFGSREDIERETARRAMTLVERTREAQRSMPFYPAGQPPPEGTQPRRLDDSDAATIKHYGHGSGKPPASGIKPLAAHVNPYSDMKSYHRLAAPALKGGAVAEDTTPSNPAEYAYSDADITAALGSVPIHRYPELKGMSSPDSLFKGNKAAVLLFLTEGRNNGHWLAVLDHDSHYEVFDSFGTAIDGNRKWLDEKKLMEFGQTLPLLSILLQKGDKPVVHNTSKLQANQADTCGRWVVWRILNAKTPLDSFVSEMKTGSGTPDDKVVELTYGILDK